jgi:hypothetical protein
VQIAPGALCALALVRSLDQPVAYAQLAPDTSSTGQGEAGPWAREPSANERSGPNGPGDGHGPPPFAYEACVDKAQGDDCSVSFGDRTIAGSCITGLNDKLFCLPDEMPPPPPGDGHGPPPDGRRVINPTL